MKNTISIRRSLAIAAALPLLLTACGDNYWNEHELDGFEEPVITDQQSIQYTLTDVDYKTLADNSTNKTLAGSELASALKAVGTQFYFTPEISAREYVPALLSDPKFPYFALSDGSSILLTYRTAQEIPAQVAAATDAKRYTVTDADYQSVWGSDNDYTPSFAPSHTAAASLPSILKANFPDAEEGDYVIVNYQTSQTDPVFTAAPDPDDSEFTLSSTIGTATLDEDITVDGYVSAICSMGYIVTDESGSIFVYRRSDFGTFDGLSVGSRVVINTTVSAYNKGFQLALTEAAQTAPGTQTFTYPAPVEFTGAKLDEILGRTDNELAIYGTMKGTVAISGNYININVAGATKANGSVYGATAEQKAQLTDGMEVTLEGYLIAIAGKVNCNFVISKIIPGGTEASTAAASRAVTVASDNENAIYTFNGTRWAPAADFAVLSHADYQAMGQTYDNLTNEDPAALLPIYLKQKFPYAQAEESKFVVYYYYASSATVVRCDQYTFDGTAWMLNNGVTTESAQFVRTGGKWIYDPNVTITLPGGKGQELSTLYFQTCVDWVLNNIDKPTGATYVTSYGNNEYYSGTSAYQGNVDLRPSAARTQYAAGYEGMTDEEIVEAEKRRFETEVMPGALSILHPDADLVDGVDVYYTINFVAYTGISTDHTIRYKVTGRGQFEFVECDW